MLLTVAGLVGAAVGDVETGLLYGSPQMWYPASGAASMPFMVACRRSTAPRSATCTLSNPYMVTRTQGTAWVYLPASSCWLVYSSVMQEGPTQPNCMWHAEFTLQVPRADSPWLTETVTVQGDFQVKNLTVDAVDLQSQTDTLAVTGNDPFVSLRGHGTLGWSCATDDGSEEPLMYPVTGHLALVRMLDSQAAGPPTALNASQTRVVPTHEFGGTLAVADADAGLYYRQFGADEQPDSGQYLSSYVAVTSVAPVEWQGTGPRMGLALVNVTTTDLSEHPVSVTNAKWRDPDGSFLGCGVELAHTNRTELRMTLERMFSVGGDYALAVSCLDDHADSYHEGRAKWALPAAWVLPVPTATCFYGRYTDDSDEDDFRAGACSVYDALGFVHTARSEAPYPQQVSFYSRSVKRRGYDEPPTFVAFMEALQEDDIVLFVGHSEVGSLNLDQEGSPAIAVDELQIRALPAEALAGLRLFWAASCESAYPSPATSICDAVLARGAENVVGFTGTCNRWGNVDSAEYAFGYMSRGYGIGEAIALARDRVLGEMPTNELKRTSGLIDNPNTHGIKECLVLKCRDGARSAIAPAFAVTGGSGGAGSGGGAAPGGGVTP